MTTENPTDGKQATEGATQPPVAPPSNVPVQLSADEIKALRELPNLVKGLQKGTDKQIGQVKSDVKRILELKEQGLNETQIQRELFLDSMIEQGGVAKPLVGNENKAQSLDTDSIINSFGIPETDPALSVLKVKYADDKATLISKAHELSLERAKQAPVNAASDLGVMRESPPPPPANREQLKQDYLSEVRKNRGNKAAILEVQKRFKTKGLDIENIGFGL